jgi:hypothetical protein
VLRSMVVESKTAEHGTRRPECRQIVHQSVAVSVSGSAVQVVVALGDRRCERGRGDGVVTRAIVMQQAKIALKGVASTETRRVAVSMGVVWWHGNTVDSRWCAYGATVGESSPSSWLGGVGCRQRKLAEWLWRGSIGEICFSRVEKLLVLRRMPWGGGRWAGRANGEHRTRKVEHVASTWRNGVGPCLLPSVRRRWTIEAL